MKTANERLAEAREALGFRSKADFAKHVGIERSTYDKIEKGPHRPSAENLERIIERFPNLNLNWLLLGAGPMLRDGQEAPSALESNGHSKLAAIADQFRRNGISMPGVTDGPTSAAATVEYANWLATKEAMREVIDTQKETIYDLRGTVEFLKAELGKFGGSLGAALFGQPVPSPVGAAALLAV